MDIDLVATQPPTHAPIKRRITGDRMSQPITLKGAVASKYLDANNEELVTLTTSHPPGSIYDPSEKYEFAPSFSVTLRSRDLGDPPLGATVEITVNLS